LDGRKLYCANAVIGQPLFDVFHSQSHYLAGSVVVAVIVLSDFKVPSSDAGSFALTSASPLCDEAAMDLAREATAASTKESKKEALWENFFVSRKPFFLRIECESDAFENFLRQRNVQKSSNNVPFRNCPHGRVSTWVGWSRHE